MQIKINMKFVLTEDEIKQAVIAFVEAEQGELQANQTVTVSLEDDDKGDLTAIVLVDTDDGAGTVEPAKAAEKPASKPRGKARAKDATLKTEPEAKDEETLVEQQEGTVEGITIKEETSAEAKAEEPPFDVEEPAKEEAAEEAAAPVAPTATVTKIFPDIANSAAATPKPAEPVQAAKSLFANLQKPTNTH